MEENYKEKLEGFFTNFLHTYKKIQKDYRRRVSNFFTALLYRYKVAKEVKRYTDKYLASDFNVIKLFRPGEEDISNIIAALVDPNGGHGQGNIFLKMFLSRLELPTEKNFEGTIVQREFSTNTGRRIDILIKLPDGFEIGIENKPWAGDQENQVKDYASYLDKYTSANYKLVFLGGGQRELSEVSISTKEKEKLEQEGKLVCEIYRSFLIPWLRDCLKECEADKVRWFIRDFIVWIENNFRGGENNE